MLQPGWKRNLLVLALLLGAIIPLLPGTNLYILTVLILMLIFIIYASAWNLLAFSGQGSLGHAAFFGIGGYASSLIALQIGISPFITIFIGAAFAAVIGVLIGLTCVRLNEWFLAMVTFGFAIIIQTVIASFAFTGGWDGYPVPKLVPPDIPFYHYLEYYSIFVFTILTIVVISLIFKSRIGLALAAIRENELEARAAGIDPVYFKLLAFAISAFIAGFAGALEIHHFGYITPEVFAVDISFWPIIYTITGGLNTVIGPVVGTIVVILLWDGLNALGITYARYIIIGVMLILMIIYLPKGLVSLSDVIEKKREETGKP